MANPITYVINANPGGNRKANTSTVAHQDLNMGEGRNPFGEIGGIKRAKFSSLSTPIGTNVSSKLGGT